MTAVLLSLALQLPLAPVEPKASFRDDPVAITVRPTDIDVKGHVNNARYVEYLQWGRWEWFEERGLTNERLTELGVVLVVVNLNLDFRKECKSGEKLSVKTTVEKVGVKSFTMSQVVNRDKAVVLEGTVTMVSIDPTTRKSRTLPEPIKSALEAALRN